MESLKVPKGKWRNWQEQSYYVVLSQNVSFVREKNFDFAFMFTFDITPNVMSTSFTVTHSLYTWCSSEHIFCLFHLLNCE